MMTRGWRATDTLPLEPELAKTVSDTSLDEEGWTSIDDAMLDSWWVVHHVSFPQNVSSKTDKKSLRGLLELLSLRSRRFRLVSEQRKTEERYSRFWPREKWKSQKNPSQLFYWRHFFARS